MKGEGGRRVDRDVEEVLEGVGGAMEGARGGRKGEREERERYKGIHVWRLQCIHIHISKFGLLELRLCGCCEGEC